jgi:hypothetical protein
LIGIDGPGDAVDLHPLVQEALADFGGALGLEGGDGDEPAEPIHDGEEVPKRGDFLRERAD